METPVTQCALAGPAGAAGEAPLGRRKERSRDRELEDVVDGVDPDADLAAIEPDAKVVVGGVANVGDGGAHHRHGDRRIVEDGQERAPWLVRVVEGVDDHRVTVETADAVGRGAVTRDDELPGTHANVMPSAPWACLDPERRAHVERVEVVRRVSRRGPRTDRRRPA